ncbi:hypothetical protein ACEE21_04035 [Clostridium baratii]|uniref:hypothetical protein n=1 Tax=Clostridium baratii TaxID=1561 RepID=UPI002A765B16|nr:hypothetical protein [Clostridium baratii]MDY3207950.1 hypothetical protein [Clostridium baratii]
MYINVADLFWIIVALLSAFALVVLILCLLKLLNVLTKVDTLLDENKNNLDTTLTNVKGISENVKDISDVATEATADAIVVKENLSNQLSTLKEIASIISSVFLKK